MAKEKLSIIAVFMLLSFSCFSQVIERVNSDTLLHDSLEAENYNHNVNLLEDSVKIIVWKDYGGTASDGSYYHIIENKSSQNLVIFFIEEENDTLPQVKLLRKKLYRRYGDFSFSVMIWDNINYEKSNNATVTPDIFVKILRPEEKFELVVPFANNDEKQIASKIYRHLLVCSEMLFSCDEIVMPNFIEVIQYYGIDYDKSEVVISADAFESFYSKYSNKKIRRTAKSQ